MLASILAILLFSLFSIECKKEQTGNRELLYLSMFLLVFYIFIDYSKVPDVETYKDLFAFFSKNSLKNFMEVDTHMEKGYVLLNIISSKIVNGFGFFYFLYSLIVVSSSIYLIKHYSCNIWLSGMVLFTSYFGSLFLLREYLAISVCMISIPFILDRKIFHFLALMFLAFCFHQSAVVFIIVYFIPFLKPSVKSLLLISVLGIFVAYTFNRIIDQIILVTEYRRLELYTTDETYSNSWKASVVPMFSLIVATMCYRKHFKTLNRNQFFFYVMCIIQVILVLIDSFGTSFSGIYRLTYYFGIGNIIMIPDALEEVKNPVLRNILILLLLTLYIYSLVSMALSQRGFGFIV